MLKKRFLLALALVGLTFGTTLQALSLSGVLDNTAAYAIECTGGGSETFGNIPAASSAYSTRNWTGDNGVTWSATDSRTDQTLSGKAIALRTSTLKNTTPVAGGIGTLSFDYKRVFTGNSTLKVFVNGVQYGADITVSSETAATFTQVINVAGNVTIEIKNSGNRTIVDNISWNCYSAAVTGPELQIADAANNNHDCGEYTLDFGSHNVGMYQDATFTIKNIGNAPLNVAALNLSNSTDFSIISPSVPFTVQASGSAIVLVRFNAVTGGEKTSSLTIVNDDTNEGSCIVNLVATGLDKCVAPVAEASTIALDSLTAASVNVTVAGVVADSYLAVVTTAGSLSAVPADMVNYVVEDSIGGGVVAYNGTAANFTLSGLTESTSYNVYVYPYNNVDCVGGPLYNTVNDLNSAFTTPVAPCIGGSETFTNMPASASAYATRTWTGDNGVVWTATDARTDQTLTGRALALRTGNLANTTPVSGGIGTLTFDYKRVFTGNSTLKVFVNNVQYGGDITVSSDTTAVYSQAINVTGPVTVRIENSGNRTVIDNLSWDCHQTPEGAELQLLDINQATQGCGFTIDLGNVEVNSSNELTFSIRNLGLQALEVSALTINNTDYSIIYPVAPFVIDSLGSEDVIVLFSSTTTGSKPAVITIESNDADESVCTVNVAAEVLTACVAPDAATGDVIVSNETESTVDVALTGFAADGYVAIISAGGTITAPVDGNLYNVNDTIGAGTVAYVGTATNFTIENLDPETAYTIFVYGYNNTGCIGGPLYSAALETTGTTTAVPCVGGSETFGNIPASSTSYGTRTWTGDNGVTWSATDARTDQVLTGKAIALRASTLKNTTPVAGGIGTLTFNYKRVFTGNSTLKVFVNGTQVGTDITVSSDTPAVFSEAVNVTGNVTIEIVNGGNRIVVDDIAWDCPSASSARQAAPQVKTTEVLNDEVKVFPNPSNGQFQLDLATETADVVIYNMLGEEVLSKKVSDNEVINLSGAQQGIYMVNVTSGTKVSTHKIIIK